MFYWIWTLIIGGLIGLIAGIITGKGKSMNWLVNIIAGLVGSSVGQAIFGSWGPKTAGMPLIPAILGAAILVIVASFILGMFNSKPDPD